MPIYTMLKFKWEGRKGEFAIDKSGKKIPLTGLIYGRHHKLFDFCEFIQVYQESKGTVTIFYTSSKNIMETKAKELFNSENLDMELKFKKIKEPYKTPSGKVLLKLTHI